MRFELTRAEPIGLAVQRLNHSATSSAYHDLSSTFKIKTKLVKAFLQVAKIILETSFSARHVYVWILDCRSSLFFFMTEV
jgi:hypothetical protein